VGGGKKSVDGQSTWKPPSDLASWDDRIAEVETVERTAEGPLLVFIIWYGSIWERVLTCLRKNGHRSCHDTTVVYDKCPQQVPSCLVI
jgi:chromobox protein 1